ATPLGRYVTALDAVRERLLDTVRALDLTDLRRPRSLPDYDVSPDWVLHHLVQHETEHRAEIAVTRDVLEGRRVI
ncbi:MAG TPA: DinB family protein, partial [Thermomicrobiales bacterium]|nr:DinB family protein [Thermomicrobiales bacterium]